MVTDFEDLIGNFYGRSTYCCGIGIIHAGQHRIQRPGGGGGPRNMKSFLGLIFTGLGGHGPLAPRILTLDL